MYEVSRYTDINERGTAVLIEKLARSDVRKLLVASSMSIYGEGLARAGGTLVEPAARSVGQLRAGRWENLGPDGQALDPVATPETKSPSLSSIYALNKYAQERMALIFGAAYGREAVALRFFNTYGPNQALSNPYTGVLAIFAARLLNGRPPMIFEDGMQRRDFVHVDDVARACRLALETPAANGHVINIGSGEARSILDVARELAGAMRHNDVKPHVTGKFRAGDIRHCYADISRAKQLLDFQPAVDFSDGVAELVEWLSGQIAIDSVDRATAELESRGLVA
jgi:dTDP-L-rhamnose 4-epimerase